MDLPKMKCLQCGHEWTPRVNNPKCCPKCISPHWNEPKVEHDIKV
jgi:predicted Zn-ribbon and HTH transcriptional regulator